MEKTTIEYIVRALDRRIKDLGEWVDNAKNNKKTWEKELATKKSSFSNVGGIGVTTEYHEPTAKKLLDKANAYLERNEPHLENYKSAREDVRKEFGI